MFEEGDCGWEHESKTTARSCSNLMGGGNKGLVVVQISRVRKVRAEQKPMAANHSLQK